MRVATNRVLAGLLAAVAVAALIVAMTTPGGARSPRASLPWATSTPPLLPGAQDWHGASSFDFGTNDTIEYQPTNVDTVPSVQAALKAAHITLMRTWAYEDTDTDASIALRLQTIKNAGMSCMFMLGTTTDLAWMEHVVGETDTQCHIYEFGNEPDNYGSIDGANIATYTAAWIADIPVLRAEAPGAVFGGPVLTWSMSNGAGSGSYGSDMAYFLATTAAAGVRADFISYHDYPCQTKVSTTAQCLAATPGDFAWNFGQVTALETQYYGATIPTGVSELNFDAAGVDDHFWQWAVKGRFMRRWTIAAENALVTIGAAFGNQFTSLNFSDDGDLDMFSDAAPYGPKPQFKGLAAVIAKYKGA